MDFGRHSAAHIEAHESEHGSLLAWALPPVVVGAYRGPWLFVTQAKGRMVHAHAEAFVRMGDRVVAHGQAFAGIHEWSEMDSYDGATRKLLQAWTLEHRALLSEAHFAVRSRLVKMGVAVANLALGNLMQVHDDLPSLARAFEALRAPPRLR